MLIDLHVRNLAVLEEAFVELGPGLNVLTGETGAGKSIVVDALALLAGARASSDLIRTGAEVLSVAGRFETEDESWRAALEAAGIEADDEGLVVRREVSREGRNRVFVNDRPVTLRLLAEVTGDLLRIHAQREELELTTAEQQRALLDAVGGDAGASLRRDVAAAHETYRGLSARLERLRGDAAGRRARIEFLTYQSEELERAAIEPGEEDALRAERDGLRHAEAIARALGGAVLALHEDEGSAVERLGAARRAIEEIGEWVPDAAGWLEEAAELEARCDELASALRRRLDGAEADPVRLDAVEARLAEIERLTRKHGRDSRGLAALAREWRDELDELTGDEDNRDELEEDAAKALEDYRTAADRLSRARSEWGGELTRRVAAELADLALPNAALEVRVGRRTLADSPLHVDGGPVEFGAWGYDRVEMLLAANPGEEAKPLARSASGGELSRIYLALQLAVRHGRESSPTMVFDEADAGLGGEAAAALGRKLRALAEGGQILAVTHLAQVASCAHRQLHVAKAVAGGRTRTEVEVLEGEGRVREVARMLAGDEITPASLEHASELLRLQPGR